MPQAAVIVDGRGTGTIDDLPPDEDDVPPPQLSISGVEVHEARSGSVPAVFTVTMDRAADAGEVVSFGYATADGSATAEGKDYAPTTGRVEIPAGDTSGTISVDVGGDTLVEGTEDFFVNLSNPTGADATLIGAQGKATIVDAAQEGLSVGEAEVTEGDEGTTPASFTVTLADTHAQPVTVAYTVSGGSATAGEDYVAAPGTLTFAPNQASQTITVDVLGDTVVEPDETFTVTLANPNGAPIAKTEGTGTIEDDDAPVPELRIGSTSVNESRSGSVPAVLTVTMDRPVNETVTFAYATADGTATAGADYTPTSTGRGQIPAGATTTDISVDVVGDTLVERTEDFFVNLSNPTGATLAGTRGTANIVDAAQEGLSIGDATVTEGNEGTTPARFTVTLAPPILRPSPWTTSSPMAPLGPAPTMPPRQER